MPTLEDALILATQAHSGQTERNGQPYIFHPLRIMCRMRTETTRIIALLHDVVEDTDITLADLREKGYSADIVNAVDALSRRDGESYDAFIDRAAANPLAVHVKLADLEDNMDVRRLPEVLQRDAQRLEQYRAAWQRLNALQHAD